MANFRRINKNETHDDANILGSGKNRGNYIAKDVHKFIEMFLTLKPNQKCFIFRPHKIPNFCTTFDRDFRFKEEIVIKNEEILEYAFRLQTTY